MRQCVDRMRAGRRRYSRRGHCFILAVVLLVSYVLICLKYATNLVQQDDELNDYNPGMDRVITRLKTEGIFFKRDTGLIDKTVKNTGERKLNISSEGPQIFAISNSSKRAVDENEIALSMASFNDVITESQRVLIEVLGRLLRDHKYIILTDIAVHENKGDAAITVGELLLMKKLGKEIIFYCNTYACDDRSMKGAEIRALQYGVDNVAVVCHGGGNLIGYREHDTLRARVFEIFKGFKRVVLPQSIWLQSQSQLDDTRRVLERHQQVILHLRDSASFDLARTHFPFNEKLLVPDSAFMIGPVQRSLRPFYDILWLRRTDVEKVNYVLPDFPPNVSVSVSDWTKWITGKGSRSIENAFLIANNGFTFLQRGRVVITDRLHGHIMCVLLHVPHVLLDTTDHKVSKYHKTWTHELEGKTVLTASTASDALDKAMFLLTKFDEVLPEVEALNALRESVFL